ncbi:hypothetical protein [Alphaspiravirus yamagawaense]|uniref:Uncharacterized protein n=1 Tax=Alphaspiravirus yamagawaense TaxID=1157339 RepID=J7QDG0_9VIRU|nr:hypothetical protein [Aeropyrum coil-shaped virus]CCG27836.1 hypothetical protein [Aeropyrum coil-shaped virus]
MAFIAGIGLGTLLSILARLVLVIGGAISVYYIYRTFSTTFQGVEQAAPIAGGALAVMAAFFMMFPIFMIMFMMMTLMISLVRVFD